MNHEHREFLRLFGRLVVAVERLAKITPPKKKSKAPVRGLTHAVGGSRRSDEPDDRGLTRGGVPPEEFWSRRER